MEKNFEPYGVVPAVVTPLFPDMSFNEQEFRKLLEYLIRSGVHGLFVTGTAGEFYGLSMAQKQAVIETAIDQAGGRAAVYAGIGGITTRECVETIRMAEACGADAVSVLTPYYIRPGQDELYQHYTAIAAASDLPILLYNNSPMSGVSISGTTAARLSRIENIIGIKDSSGDGILTMEYLRADPSFYVLAGREPLILSTLSGGGCGMVASSGNLIPKLLVNLFEAFHSGDTAKARELQTSVTEVYNLYSLGTFPSILKEGLALLGFDPGPPVPPVLPLEAKDREKIRRVLTSVGALTASIDD